jgi:heparan-alpha-glucosaminide N-acetyltransferase
MFQEVAMQAALGPSLASPETTRSPQPALRNFSIDAYRGFVMLLMMAEVLQLSRVARAFPGNQFWGWLAYHQSHVAWAGCSLHDTIQPGFSFLVGVALPYSIASRLATSWRKNRFHGKAFSRRG